MCIITHIVLFTCQRGRADILVRSKRYTPARPGFVPGRPLAGHFCGQECPRACGCGSAALGPSVVVLNYYGVAKPGGRGGFLVTLRRARPPCLLDRPCDTAQAAQALRLRPQLNLTMNFALNRRSFLKRTALAAGALSATPLLPFPNLLAAASPNSKLNCVQIGCGGRGMYHLDRVVNQSKDNLVAI